MNDEAMICRVSETPVNGLDDARKVLAGIFLAQPLCDLSRYIIAPEMERLALVRDELAQECRRIVACGQDFACRFRRWLEERDGGKFATACR